MMDLIVDFASQRPPRSFDDDCNNCQPQEQEVRALIEPRRVRFDDQAKVTFVKDISSKHKSSLFYTKSELVEFKQAYAQALREVLTNSTTIPNYEGYIRTQDPTEFLGLELGLNKKAFRMIVSRRKALKSAIKLEQERQERLGICDCDTLANVSQVKSEWSRNRARAIAIWHADGYKCA